MRRSLGAPELAANTDCLPAEADSGHSDPLIAATKELSRSARNSSAPERVRGTVARFVQERPDLLFELFLRPGEVKALDECTLTFCTSKIARELLASIRAHEWQPILALGRQFLD